MHEFSSVIYQQDIKLNVIYSILIIQINKVKLVKHNYIMREINIGY